MSVLQDKYILTNKKLGSGHFAEVLEGKVKNRDERVAIKCVDKKKLSRSDLKAVFREAKLLQKIKHKHVIRLYDFYDESLNFFIVTELLEGGELFDRIVTKEQYNEKDAATVVEIIATALAYCHDHGVVHRDIKPENLLLVSKNDDTSLKLADFGFAAEVKEENSGLKTPCGTPGYCAPEIITGKKYDKAVDLWSLGVVTFILLGGYPPFYDRDQKRLLQKIAAGKYEFDPMMWNDISKDAKNLIRGLLQVNPKKRLTTTRVLKHPWIAKSQMGSSYKQLSTAQKGLKEYQVQRKLKLAVNTLGVLNKLERALADS